MDKNLLKLLICGFIFVFCVSFLCAQSKETGAIEGIVTDEDMSPLPGTSVTLSSPNLIGGPRVTLTSESGKYRFVLLPPGTYTIEVRLEGFVPAKREGVRLSVGVTLTADFVLQMGAIQEEVLVVAETPLIDIKSSSTGEVTLDEQYLDAIPNSNVTMKIVDLAPGVTQSSNQEQVGSAFGADVGSGVQVQSDGLNYADPTYGYSGSVRIDYNIVQETKIMGIGAPAEYGEVEGVIANVITKSGGNDFHGNVGLIYQDEGWNSTNTDVEELKAPAESLFDLNGNLGGPFIKDRLWFFAGYRRFDREQQVTGYPDPAGWKRDNFFFKLTAQATSKTRLQAYFAYEPLKYTNLGGAQISFEAASQQDDKQRILNLSLFHIFSDSTFLEGKIAGFYYTALGDGKQGRDVSGRADIVTGMTTVNSSSFVDAKIKRTTASAALSHYIEKFLGSHDFKLGFYYSSGTSAFAVGFNGGSFFQDSMGSPFLRIDWQGLDSDTTNRTLSFYIQDSWKVSKRLVINPGLRLNIYRGIGNKSGDTIYKTSGLAPRIGFSFDPWGDNRTVIKAHYGWYYAGMKSSNFKKVDDIWYDQVLNIYVPPFGYFEYLRLTLGGFTTIDPNIKHPRQEEFTVGIDRELVKDLSLSVNYIWRNMKNLIFDVNTVANYVPFQTPDPETGAVYTIYGQTNPGQLQLLYTNPKNDGTYDSVIVDPKRKYQALEVVLHKRFSNNWMLLASYVYSKSRGTIANTYGGSQASDQTGSIFSDPNYQINLDGRPFQDPTHMFKLQGAAILPLDFSLSVNFSYITGTTYTRMLPVFLPQGLINIMTEENGSRRLDAYVTLDIRLEKQFRFKDRFRIGIFADAFNLFNRSVPTSVLDVAGPNFETPTALTLPRAVRAGVRFFF